ncbi:MAG: SdpI family protein [Thermoflexaceae bacterium]|nr:SdpI family protein [Thermoflexaceae bacterium]
MIVALLVMTLAGVIVVTLGWLGLQGKLPRNHVAGIRTPYTMRSDETWYATHRHGGPILIFAGVAAVSAGLALVPFAAAGAVSDSLTAATALAMAAVLLMAALGSWLIGTRRARAELEAR